MQDFLDRFGVNGEFSNVRSGTIVGLLSIGTLIGAMIAAPIADIFGRRVAIIYGNVIFWVGVIVQMAATYTWYQVALGRWVAGLGVGGEIREQIRGLPFKLCADISLPALSVMTPMYMSETAPRQIRGSMVRYEAFRLVYHILLTHSVATNFSSLWVFS